MKRIFSFLFVMIVITGCEPGYRIYISNSSPTDLFIKTYPSIESLYNSQSTYYDSIITYKLKDEGNFSIYRVKPFKTLFLWGNIGGGPTVKELPFDYVAIISGNDTTVLDSKEKIIEQTTLADKKRNFYIKVRK